MVIVVIGESCTDKFIYGKTDRLSPEAPVPVFVPTNTKKNSGMAGNVVRNITAINPLILTFGLHNKNEITKTRIVDKKTNHMFIRIDEGEDNIEKFDLNEVNKKIISDADAVIISDYNKGFLSDNDIIEISKISKVTIMDSKRKLTDLLIENVDFLKLNEKEYNNNKTLTNLEKVIITLGDKGVLYNNKIFPSPRPQETIDVSGAGDTFTASFTIKFLETDDVLESINFANLMSSIVVSKKGVTTP